MTIEAILWDFGGVLTTSPFEAFNHFEAGRGLPKDLIRTVNSTNPDSNAWALLERGEIDSDAFDRKFLAESTALGHPLRGAEVLPLLGGELRPRMVEALVMCKERFKIGCITNNVAHGHGAAMASSRERGSRASRGNAALPRDHRKLQGRHPQARPAHLSDDVRTTRRRRQSMRLSRRFGHQLQARGTTWNDRDQRW